VLLSTAVVKVDIKVVLV